MPSATFQLTCAALAITFAASSFCDSLSADDKHYKHKKHHRHNPGFTGVAITPNGVGFSFQNQNFGIGIAPGTIRSIQQRRVGDYGHFHREPAYAQPIHVTPVIPEPVLAPVADPYAPQRLVAPLSETGLSPHARPVIRTTAAASTYQAAAEYAFRNRDFAAAAKAIGHATLEEPDNGQIHLFAAQIAFAIGDFEVAAEAVLVATELLDLSDWFSIGQNYRQFYLENEYVRQMDRLNAYCDEFPHHSFAQSLRAFHFFGLGHTEAATRMLNRAIEINPQDELAQRLAAVTRQAVVAPAPKLVSSQAIGPQQQTGETPKMYSILEN